MKRVLVFDDNGQDPRAALEIFREHGFAATLSTGNEDIRGETGQERYLDIIENAPVGIFRSTLGGKFISVNPATARILKYDSPQDLIETVNERSIAEVIYLDPERRREVIENLLLQDGWQVCEVQYRCRDGSIVTCRDYIRPVPGTEGREWELEGFVEDVTDRKKTEEALQESEELFRIILENIMDPVFITDDEGRFTFICRNVQHILGYTAEEIQAMGNISKLFGKEIFALDELETQGEIHNIDCMIYSKDGSTHDYLITVKRVSIKEGTILYVCRDITDRKRADEKISAALAEKVVLLKEIHHRVKNNLQIITSLLELQACSISDEKLRDYLQESQDRIRSMALIHEQLYKSKDFSYIDFGAYIKNLSQYLFNSYAADTGRISLKVDTGDICVGIDRSIPCGLIVNELISNAMKHAFPGEHRGEINVRLSTEKERINLAVTDNGVGMPPGFDAAHSETMGLQLVTMLTRQLQGEMRIDSGQEGTSFVIDFPAA